MVVAMMIFIMGPASASDSVVATVTMESAAWLVLSVETPVVSYDTSLAEIIMGSVASDVEVVGGTTELILLMDAVVANIKGEWRPVMDANAVFPTKMFATLRIRDPTWA